MVDSRVSNLGSVIRGIERIGETAKVAQDASDITSSEAILIPGVGAFRDGMRALHDSKLAPALREVSAEGTPILGICLGMHMLMEESEEGGGVTAGLGLVPGSVTRLQPREARDRVPNVGWCDVSFVRPCVLTRDLPSPSTFYFTHSFVVNCRDGQDSIGQMAFGGSTVTVVLQRGNVFGTQFHTEKSQAVGLTLLRNFAEYARAVNQGRS